MQASIPSSIKSWKEGGGRDNMGHMIRGPYAYAKMESDDPEERRHRRAQFLIYKVLQRVSEAETGRSPRPAAFFGVRLCKLRVKLGKRLKRSRKKVASMASKARNAACKRIMKQIKDLQSLPHFFLLHVKQNISK
ncbi:hypothetical protein SAY86_003966 [Trapa natans]|uniref:Uncharacterized protein n=1 Tax=Trapa natans TaxID=22666 RepID=A0AAN7MF44_TRANT|nr:hypothetical protein SAY86_003966 [Trapa natans]